MISFGSMLSDRSNAAEVRLELSKLLLKDSPLDKTAGDRTGISILLRPELLCRGGGGGGADRLLGSF